MEDTNGIRASLEELGLNTEQIDEVIPLIVKRAAPEEASPSSVDDLKEQMREEEDCYKKAALAAKIISIRLDGDY